MERVGGTGLSRESGERADEDATGKGPTSGDEARTGDWLRVWVRPLEGISVAKGCSAAGDCLSDFSRSLSRSNCSLDTVSRAS